LPEIPENTAEVYFTDLDPEKNDNLRYCPPD